MNFRHSIPLQKSVDFCNSVIDTATVDGQYIPALFDYAVRVNAILFFSDYEFKRNDDGLIKQDEACKVAYETDYYENILEHSKQLYCLINACEEQIRMNHDILLAALRPADQMERLVDMLQSVLGGSSDIAKTLNPESIGKLVERLSSIDDKSIIDFVTAKQEQSIDTPKAKRGRKPGSKNKSKDDKIIHIPGQMSVEDISDTTE